MDGPTLWNLAAYSVQIVVVVTAGTLAHAALRLPASSVGYVFWRGVLALCLVLPLLQGRQAPAAEVSLDASAGVETVVTGVSAATASGARSLEWTALAGIILAAGIALRFGWLALTLGRLRRLRCVGRPAGPGEDHEDLQRLLGTRADVRYVPGLGMPVTFGALRPVVLLPASLTERPEPIQRAVVCHELLHVQRRDWLWRVVEQMLLAVFWFNPAMWWLMSRIDLSREATVDELAVLATGRRRTYIEALVSFTEEAPAATTAFATRRHLFLRIQSLSREAVMSSTRVVAASAVLIVTVAAGSLYAVNEFPLTTGGMTTQDTPGPLEQRARLASRENPIPRRLHYEAPAYPPEAQANGVSGSLFMRVTVDESGFIGEARRLRFLPGTRDDASGLVEAFTQSASNALRQWRYEPPKNGPVTFDVMFTFRPDGEVRAQERMQAVTEAVLQGSRRRTAQPPLVSASGAAPIRVGGTIKTPMKIRDVRPVYPELARQARVRGVVILEALVGPDGSVENAWILRSIPLLDQAALDAVMQWRFVPTLLNGEAVPVIMTVTVHFAPDGDGGGEQVRGPEPEVIYSVQPRYTAEAMRAKAQGTVETEVTIGTDGSVVDARVVRSLPMLDEQALAAVRQWRFAPVPQPVTTTVEFTFTMRDR